jgi:hypothetical protein
MSTQIFKKQISNDILFQLLDDICLKNEKFYTFNIIAFKKGVYNETIQKFIEFCNPYYHISKRKYLEKPITHKSFSTILRQIFNFNQIKYTTQIKYDKSTYDIVYYIYFNT